MGYYRPVKVVGSAAGRPGNPGAPGTGGAIVITSDTEPTTREDDSALVEGDFWWDETDDVLHIYIDGAWKLAGGQGAINTSELSLTNPTTSRFGSQPSTLPDTEGLGTQQDYNEWLFTTFEDQDARISALEAGEGGGSNLANFTYIGESPIAAFQEPATVTHFMDMDTLTNIDDANSFNDARRARERLRNRSLNNTVDNDGFTFTALAPVTVDVQDDTVTHGMLISDLNSLQ